MARFCRGGIMCGTVVLFLAAGAIAFGQPRREGGRRQGPPRMMGGGSGGLLMLLGIEQVQKELKLSDEQNAKLRELGEKLRSEMQQQFAGMEKLTEEQRRARMAELREKMQKEGEARAAETQKQIAAILKPEQLKRLKQIQLQQEGPAALRRPEVAEALGLSKDQLDQLEKIADESREKMQELFRAGREADKQAQQPRRFPESREKFQEIRKDSEKRSMGVLTAEQKKKLGEMLGEPFELDRSRLFGGRGGFGGPRPGPSDQPPPKPKG